MKERISTRFFAVLTTIAVAFSLCLGTAVPAFGDNVAPTDNLTFTFSKYLVMDASANVPNATFNFTITSGAAVDASDTGPAIYAGPGGATVGSAEFTPGDQAFDGAPDGGSAMGSKYATKEVTVDFSNVSFNAPGIYRYVITETASSQSGITNDSASTRTLDVYVEYESNFTNLKVSRYVLHAGDENPNTATKSNGFTNTYDTNDLTLEKQVTGNQGDRDKYFEFTVLITDAVPDTVYTVNLDNAEASPSVDGASKSNLETLTATGGTVNATYYLKDDQSITIQGLTSDTNYTINETSYAADGYATSNTVDTVTSSDGNTTGERSMDGGDHTVVFTNHKQGTVPTGILLETGPYILMGAVVVAALIALLAASKRRSRK